MKNAHHEIALSGVPYTEKPKWLADWVILGLCLRCGKEASRGSHGGFKVWRQKNLKFPLTAQEVSDALWVISGEGAAMTTGLGYALLKRGLESPTSIRQVRAQMLKRNSSSWMSDYVNDVVSEVGPYPLSKGVGRRLDVLDIRDTFLDSRRKFPWAIPAENPAMQLLNHPAFAGCAERIPLRKRVNEPPPVAR